MVGEVGHVRPLGDFSLARLKQLRSEHPEVKKLKGDKYFATVSIRSLKDSKKKTIIPYT